MSRDNGISFDESVLRNLTVGEMQVFQQADMNGDLDTTSETLAAWVSELPFGDPSDPETYWDLPRFGEYQDIIDELRKTTTRIINGQRHRDWPEAEFDMSQITAREWADFTANVQNENINGIIGLLMKTITENPFGDMTETDDYLAMNYFGEFGALTRQMMEAAKKEQRRSRKQRQSGSGSQKGKGSKNGAGTKNSNTSSNE